MKLRSNNVVITDVINTVVVSPFRLWNRWHVTGRSSIEMLYSVWAAPTLRRSLLAELSSVILSSLWRIAME